jgi:shikimate kinase
LADDPRAVLTRLDAERRPLYRELATVVVDVDELSPPQVVHRIVAAIRAGPAVEAMPR